MPRYRTRAKKRRIRQEELRAEFARNRDDPVALPDTLKRIAASGDRLWSIAEIASGDKPLNEDERAMIAQAVAPGLIWTKPRSVKRRLDPRR